MPIVNFPEFEQYKAQGYKGTFVGGCVERGEGSSFRRKAHAHCFRQDKHMGWICVRSAKRLYDKQGRASLLMWHEMSHVITKDGHGRKFYMWLRDHSTIRKDEERVSQWAYLCRHYKDPVKAYDRIKGRKTKVHWVKVREESYGTVYKAIKTGGVKVAKKGAVTAVPAEAAVPEKQEEVKVDPIVEVTGDPQVKKMGIAKAGGFWYKNYHSGRLYRIIEKDGKPELAETRDSAISPKVAKAQAHNEAIKDKMAGKKAPKAAKAAPEAKGDSRAALMERAKEKGYKYFRILNREELVRIMKSECSAKEREEITEAAKKRWQNCPFFQKKAKKG
jgi:hypothetical protein